MHEYISITFMKVMVFGTFDILHPGHLNFFKQAKKHGDYLIVVVARDKTVVEAKGRLPRNPENVRLNNLKNAKIADKVVLGRAGDKYEIIRKLKPNRICLGYDQKFFIEKLHEGFPQIKIVRLKPYKPEIYKSSFIKNSLI